MKNRIKALLLVIPFFMSTPAWADEISDQIKMGLTAYEEKDYRTAVDELKFVVALLEKLKNDQNLKLLPSALEGWEKVETDNKDNQVAMAMMGGGASMKGKYIRGEKEKVEIEILANSPLLSMMRMMLNNPAMMAGEKNTTPFRYKRSKGMKKVNGNKSEIMIVVAGQIMIKVVGSNLKDDAVLKEYLDAIDIAKLKGALL